MYVCKILSATFFFFKEQTSELFIAALPALSISVAIFLSDNLLKLV